MVIFRERTHSLTDADLECQIMKNLAILQKNILNIRCNVIKKELEDKVKKSFPTLTLNKNQNILVDKRRISENYL